MTKLGSEYFVPMIILRVLRKNIKPKVKNIDRGSENSVFGISPDLEEELKKTINTVIG